MPPVLSARAGSWTSRFPDLPSAAAKRALLSPPMAVHVGPAAILAAPARARLTTWTENVCRNQPAVGKLIHPASVSAQCSLADFGREFSAPGESSAGTAGTSFPGRRECPGAVPL